MLITNGRYFSRGRYSANQHVTNRAGVYLGFILDVPREYRKELGRMVEEALYGVDQPYLLAPDRPSE